MIDFDGIRAANPIADVVGRYIDLRRAGSEWQARCPFHNDRSPSFYVVPKKAKAFCMACGWQGDVVDFVAEIDGVDTKEAARRLGHDELPTERRPLPPLPPDHSDDWVPIVPVPKSVAQPFADHGGRWVVFNPKRERDSTLKPAASWAYRDAIGALLGWVVRCVFDDGRKWTPSVTWCRHRETGEERWCLRPFLTPRPLMGLDALAARPEAPVLVVEGEKCAEAAARALRGFVVVTWPGGTQGVKHADWQPLAGRAVTIWPDADGPGIETGEDIAARCHALGCAVRVIDVAGQPKGWDIADAIADGMDTAALVAWCKVRVRAWGPEFLISASENQNPIKEEAGARIEGGDGCNAVREVSEGAPAGSDSTLSDAISATVANTRDSGELPGAERDEPAPMQGEIVDLPPTSAAYDSLTTWSSLDLVLGERGAPIPNLDNAARVLERHPETQGRFWYDEFLERILSDWNPRREPREWTDTDDVRLGLWLQRKMGIGRMAVGTARDAVTAVAMAHRRNELQDWLRALVWDGQPRMHLLFPFGLGAEASDYTQAVGRCFLVGMAARALSPGCKVDTMPILEGPQGKGKSTALQVLAGAHWYAVSSESVLSKDFFQTLQGKWLIEIAEMDTFGRAENAAVKRVTATQVDRYRAPYGRRPEDHPRSSVFAGSVNEDEYLRDPTGARRFWPIRCGELDLAWIARWREQLFAEAVAAYRAGTPWWDVPVADAQREQEQRRVGDPWEGVIAQWLSGRADCTVNEALEDALGMKPESWDTRAQMRVATVLKLLGWVNAGNARRGGHVVKLWRGPLGSYGRNDELL